MAKKNANPISKPPPKTKAKTITASKSWKEADLIRTFGLT
jgi:hypothetical protein